MEESPNAAALAQRLDEGAIWRASRKDQEELWRFVANLLTKDEDMLILWRYTLGQFSDRIALKSEKSCV
jgi:hypothetical protein